MGLLDRFRKPAAPEAQPAQPASKRKSKPAASITCSCGKTFDSEAKHHQHLHDEHPEHAH
jgi:hypothetical protein